ESGKLLSQNHSFRRFQIGFFIAGSGIMFMKPSLPIFLTNQHLSLFQLLSLFTIVDAIGFLIASPVWVNHLKNHNIHRTSSFVVACFAIHPICLLLAWINPIFLFTASFFYGAAQAGSRLIWNMSGPILCGNASSTQYTSVNILAVSIRGSIVPLLGGIFSCFFGATHAFQVGLLCLGVGSLYHLYASRQLARLAALQ
ncbi:MAG TPA: hypothetical protein VN457_03705, partial [Chlamydiales bacterium]|nr:hypothetical protein [Chlamydiales bacterium]